MKNLTIRLYKRVKSEMPLFFKRLGAMSTAVTAATITAMQYKEYLPEFMIHYLGNILSFAIAITIFCVFTKKIDLTDTKNEDKIA